jgi:hypothetical protein
MSRLVRVSVSPHEAHWWNPTWFEPRIVLSKRSPLPTGRAASHPDAATPSVARSASRTDRA